MAITAANYNVPTGNVAQVNRGTFRSYDSLWTEGSKPEDALLASLSLKAGYGVLPGGTIVAQVADGKFVPYVETTFDVTSIAITPVVADIASGDSTCYIGNEESSKYAVGDILIVAKDGAVYHDAGAITAIAVEGGRTKITFTNVTGVTAYTVAEDSHIYVKSGAAGKFSDAMFILSKSEDTGVDSAAGSAQGGTGVGIVSHAALNAYAIWNKDAAAKSALGYVEYGNTVYVK